MVLQQLASSALVNPAYLRAMAFYNAEMNQRIYAAAQRLPEDARQLPRGAFWGSIHGTLCHLLWADLIWLWRFDEGAKPCVSQADSAALMNDFIELRQARVEADERISSWADRVTEAWLHEEQEWFSMSTNREMRHSRGLLVMHLFNHQTHHRGQAHAMIAAAGEKTGDTDLFLIFEQNSAHDVPSAIDDLSPR
jgi:uncharacterized damage-inducible protein DinB